LGWAELLKSGRLAESRREHAIDVIFDNAHQQTKLIDDLLDISRILSGKLRLERDAVDLRTVVQGALDGVVPAAEAKGLRLLTTIEDDPAIRTFYGDAARLPQIVWNLASNAVKFTPNGGTIQVRVRRHEGSVEISVIDTGRGIGHEFLPYVFQP